MTIAQTLHDILHPVFGTSTSPLSPAEPASDAAFDAAMNFIMDGSRDGHRLDSAPGEKFVTIWGITEDTWNDAVQHGVVTGKQQDMTIPQRDAIYRVDYWNALCCPALNPGVALMIFNEAVLSGKGHTARLLQRLVGVPQDGMIGPQTYGAANKIPPRDLIHSLAVADWQYLQSLPSAPRYIGGWERREKACRALAIKLTT